jgi:hypothetical protein
LPFGFLSRFPYSKIRFCCEYKKGFTTAIVAPIFASSTGATDMRDYKAEIEKHLQDAALAEQAAALHPHLPIRAEFAREASHSRRMAEWCAAKLAGEDRPMPLGWLEERA